MNLITIKSLYNSFSKQEKLIADYVFSHPDIVITLSVSEVSEKLKVGNATIIRFCKKAGVSGFQEFKIELAKDIARKEETIYAKALRTRDKSHLFDDVTSENICALKDNAKIINKRKIQTAADKILAAGHLVIYGAGIGISMAVAAKYKFAKLGIRPNAELDIHFRTVSCNLISKKDVILVFCFNDEEYGFSEIVRVAKKKGAFVILITNYEDYEMTKNADITIFSTAATVTTQDNELTTMLTQLNILDMLYTYMAMKVKEKIEKKRLIRK